MIFKGYYLIRFRGTMSSAMGQSSFKYAAAEDWNDLPKELRELSSVFGFKNKLFF